MEQSNDDLLRQVSGLLLQHRIKIVFAESCTGGLISATLARVPGISKVLCGSAVVYRLDTKTEWLGVPARMLVDPGPVSEPVARAMAEGVLAHTPEAVLAASITGHLGPDAPPEEDGLVFIGLARRGKPCLIVEHRLPTFTPIPAMSASRGFSQREQRQQAAVEFVFGQIAKIVRGDDFDHESSDH